MIRLCKKNSDETQNLFHTKNTKYCTTWHQCKDCGKHYTTKKGLSYHQETIFTEKMTGKTKREFKESHLFAKTSNTLTALFWRRINRYLKYVHHWNVNMNTNIWIWICTVCEMCCQTFKHCSRFCRH